MGIKNKISTAFGLNRYSESEDPNQQDMVTNKIESQQSQNIDISNQEKSALEIDRNNQSHGVGTCPYCKSGQIKEETVTFGKSQERSVSQSKGVKAGASITEKTADSAGRSNEREINVYSCDNGEQQCPRHIRPGDVSRIGELKSEGARPYETKKTYNDKIKQIKNKSISENETQSRTQGL